MKKIGKFILAAIVIDYFRVAAVQTYTIVRRMVTKDQDYWTAVRKTGPSWKDKVTFYEDLEKEV